MLGLQHLDMTNLRGRNEWGRDGQGELCEKSWNQVDTRKAQSDAEFDFGPIEEIRMFRLATKAKDEWTCANKSAKWRLVRHRGSGHKGKSKPEPT